GLGVQSEVVLRMGGAADCGQRGGREQRVDEVRHGVPPPLRWSRKARARLHGSSSAGQTRRKRGAPAPPFGEAIASPSLSARPFSPPASNGSPRTSTPGT